MVVYQEKFKINIGDWSGDGHGYVERIIVQTTELTEDIKDAFISSATDLGLLVRDRFLICDDYADNCLKKEHQDILIKHNIKFADLIDSEDNSFIDSKALACLVLRIAQIKLPFEYKFITETMTDFNGFWNSKLNTSIGYGIYQD